MQSADIPGSTWIGVNCDNVSRRITEWMRGRHQVLFANRMLMEGFDCPRLSRVWLNKSTDSQLMLVQCAGRALRTQPGKRASIYCGSQVAVELLWTAFRRCDQPPLSLAALRRSDTY